jgi:NTE family protein
MISPRLGRINLFDFHRADETIAIGTEATEKSIEAISESIAALT